jgi:glutathione S-transferase
MAHLKRLITIGPSHYCEKARWALDRIDATYVEDAYPPLLHMVPMRLAGGRSTPVLVTPHRTFKDSTDILKFVDRVGPVELRLYPEDPVTKLEVEQLEDLFDDTLGPHARRWVYQQLMKDRQLFIDAITTNATPRARSLTASMASFVEKVLRAAMKINESGAQRSLEKLEALFDTIDLRLADGRRFLVGDRFSAADLAFAALGAPLLLPAEYGVPLPAFERLPIEARERVEAFRARPAGQLGLRLYREERRRAVA